MNRIKNNESGFSAVEIVMVIVIVGLIGAVGYLVYKNQHTTTKTVVVTKVVKAPAQSSGSMAVNSNIIKFPNLGVEITVPDSIKDITYSSVNTATFPQGLSGTIINLSTAFLTKLDKDCSDTGMAPPLGALSKVNGQYPTDATIDNSVGQLIKQYPNYYISFSGPQAACSSVDSTSNLGLANLATLKSSLSTISLIQ